MTTNKQRIAAQRRNKNAGSPIDAEPVFISVAKLRRPHGLKGELLVTVLTDFPDRLQPGFVLLLGDEHSPVTIKTRRSHNQGLLLSFEELPTLEDIEHLRNQNLYVNVADVPELEEGEFYHHQIIGFKVIDEAGEELGHLAEILETGANDVYIVHSKAGKELLLPATSEVILEMDATKQLIIARLIPGLID